jgi:NAD(P)-dependent dehydrogenase (short-subunit alcohol dehydrogenase family)
MNKLVGKIALITGGNSGIGLATAKQFVNQARMSSSRVVVIPNWPRQSKRSDEM